MEMMVCPSITRANSVPLSILEYGSIDRRDVSDKILKQRGPMEMALSLSRTWTRLCAQCQAVNVILAQLLPAVG